MSDEKPNLSLVVEEGERLYHQQAGKNYADADFQAFLANNFLTLLAAAKEAEEWRQYVGATSITEHKAAIDKIAAECLEEDRDFVGKLMALERDNLSLRQSLADAEKEREKALELARRKNESARKKHETIQALEKAYTDEMLAKCDAQGAALDAEQRVKGLEETLEIVHRSHAEQLQISDSRNGVQAREAAELREAMQKIACEVLTYDEHTDMGWLEQAGLISERISSLRQRAEQAEKDRDHWQKEAAAFSNDEDAECERADKAEKELEILKAKLILQIQATDEQIQIRFDEADRHRQLALSSRAAAINEAAKIADLYAKDHQATYAATGSDLYDTEAKAARTIEAEILALLPLDASAPTAASQSSSEAENATGSEGGGQGDSFQERVQPWMMACFGPESGTRLGDREERHHRFLEEALELVQACGVTPAQAYCLVDYVFNRPAGEIGQEVGGVMVTLAALCLVEGLDMQAAGEAELARVWANIDAIRAKHQSKPCKSPLPGPSSSAASAEAK